MPPVGCRLAPPAAELALAVLGRAGLLGADMERRRAELQRAVEGRRVLAVGGAGSIGTSTVLQLAALRPALITVVDSGENSLAELVRRVRSDPALHATRLEAEPLDYGGALARRLLREREREPFQLVFAFAALKHVRSERDALSCARLLETNLLAADRFLGALRRGGHGQEGVFFVSTDKAVRPASVMGASKRAMEGVLWAHAGEAPASLVDGGEAPPLPRVCSARFANVLFSEGSITAAFLSRLAHRQPLSAPSDVRRYLLSPTEAGQLCLLSALLAPHEHLLVPRLPAGSALDLASVAERILAAHGLGAVRLADPDLARNCVEQELGRGSYPLLVTTTDTPGEKEEEELFGADDPALDIGLAGACAVRGRPLDLGPLRELLGCVDRTVRDVQPSSLPELIRLLAAAVPEFEHRGGTGGLDQKM